MSSTEGALRTEIRACAVYQPSLCLDECKATDWPIGMTGTPDQWGKVCKASASGEMVKKGGNAKGNRVIRILAGGIRGRQRNLRHLWGSASMGLCVMGGSMPHLERGRGWTAGNSGERKKRSRVVVRS